MRIDCSAPRTTRPTAITNSPNNPSRTSFTPMPPASPEKKSDNKTMVAISAIEAPATDEPSEGRVNLTRVLQDRDHDPERRGGQGDAEEKRRLDEPARVEAKTDQQGESERGRVSERGDAEQGTAKALVLDFEAGEQKQKGEPQ
jgi:hypothetical protein